MKMLVSDFDDTIYQNKIVSQYDVDMINLFKEKGNTFVIATGRCFNDLVNTCQKFSLKFDYAICNQGATIFDNKGKILFLKTIDLKEFKAVYDYLKENGLENVIAFDIDTRDVSLDSENITKLKVRLKNNKDVLNIKKYIEDKFSSMDVCLFKDEGKYINVFDIVPRNTNKAFSVDVLANTLKIKDIYTIGDNLNDLKMIQKYKGYSVLNAVSELKKASIKSYESISGLIGDIIN